MATSNPQGAPRRMNDPMNLPVQKPRRDTIVPEAGNDPYRLTLQFPDGTACGICGAVFARGRWQWPEQEAKAGGGATCPACQRIKDGYFAGELTVTGAFVREHRADIEALLKAEARIETDEHPLNRVGGTESFEDGMRLVTTDVHLARRLGEALFNAYEGDLDITYPPGAETVTVRWTREDAHAPAPARPKEAGIPIEIIGKGMEIPAPIEAAIRERIDRLHRFHGRIMSCRVTVESPEAHRRQGGPYSISVQLEVPGPDVVVNRQHATDIRVAVRFAFQAAQRVLEDQVRKMRPEPEPQDDRLFGTVLRVFGDEGYGFLEAEDGHEVYFHENSVLGAPFAALGPGEQVRYHEGQGEKGPHATSVFVRGRS